MAYKVEIKASGNTTTCSKFEVTTGEYYQKLGYVELYDYIDDYSSEDCAWFVVFSRDKKEYESLIDFNIDEEEKMAGIFDIPIFEKDGYINIGVYGYKIVTETNFDGTTKSTFERIYSSAPCLCEIEKGIYPKKPIPSPNTYETLNREIKRIQYDTSKISEIEAWQKSFDEEEIVKDLRKIFHQTDEEGIYRASYKDIYELIDYYFYPDSSHDPGSYADKILNRYFEVKIKLNGDVWEFEDTSMTFEVVRNKIKVEHLIPYIIYTTNEDVHRTMYSELVDDDKIVFPESVIVKTQTGSDESVTLTNFTIWNEDGGKKITREPITIVGGATEKFEEKANKKQLLTGFTEAEQQKYYPSLWAIIHYAQTLDNKIDIIDQTSKRTEKYPSEKAVVDYVEGKFPEGGYELLSNKQGYTLDDDPEHYPSTKAVRDYAEDKSNKVQSISNNQNDDQYYPSVSAVSTYVTNYSENKTNKKINFTSINDEYYPSIAAVVNYVGTKSAEKFDNGVLTVEWKDTGGTPTLVKTHELIYQIPPNFAGTISGQTSHEKIADLSYSTEEYRPHLAEGTLATIKLQRCEENGHWQVYVEEALTERTPLYLDYYYYSGSYQYLLHFYNGTQETSIVPFDLSKLKSSGGGSGGGTSFDKVSVIKDSGGIDKLVFYKDGNPLSIEDGSLAKVQLASSTVTPSEDKLKTNVSLKDKENNELTNFDLKFLTANEMTTLKALI